MDKIDANQLLSQMKALAKQAHQEPFQTDKIPMGRNEFGHVLKEAIDNVDALQNESNDLAIRFERGDKSINLSEVMIAMQKANISFQTAAQVRNHLVNAYHDIINMPI